MPTGSLWAIETTDCVSVSKGKEIPAGKTVFVDISLGLSIRKREQPLILVFFDLATANALKRSPGKDLAFSVLRGGIAANKQPFYTATRPLAVSEFGLLCHACIHTHVHAHMRFFQRRVFQSGSVCRSFWKTSSGTRPVNGCQENKKHEKREVIRSNVQTTSNPDGALARRDRRVATRSSSRIVIKL